MSQSKTTYPCHSQSKTICPRCQRPPGGRHSDACPRSRARMAALHESLTKPFRLLWKKGFIAYRKPFLFGLSTQICHTFNPGVPRVVKGSNPRAGGIPSGKRDEAAAFLQALGLEKAP